MKHGTRIICVDDEDMLEFLNFIRDAGGQCVCQNYETKELLVVRGTNNEKMLLFNVDGVLGVVNVDASNPGESVEQA